MISQRESLAALYLCCGNAMLEATLFYLKREHFTIDICARFNEAVLVIDGYDIGETVKEYWGDSEYEYCMKILIPGVDALCSHFGIAKGDKKGLLETLQARYNTNVCYSQLEELVRAL